MGCSPDTSTLCLLGNRFQARVEFANFEGNEFSTAAADASGRGRAVSRFDDTGFFWFFQEDELEIIVKMLDGRELNGNFWVFAAATTNVEYTLTVTDTQTDTVRNYFNPASQFSVVRDTTAFPGTVPVESGNKRAGMADARAALAAPSTGFAPTGFSAGILPLCAGPEVWATRFS